MATEEEEETLHHLMVYRQQSAPIQQRIEVMRLMSHRELAIRNADKRTILNRRSDSYRNAATRISSTSRNARETSRSFNN